jgi:hypothetical protein
MPDLFNSHQGSLQHELPWVARAAVGFAVSNGGRKVAQGDPSAVSLPVSWQSVRAAVAGTS